MVTTVTMSGPGTTTIVEDTAAAVAALGVVQTGLIEKNFGAAAVKIPGTTAASLSSMVGQQAVLINRISALETSINKLTMATSKLENQLSAMTTGVAHVVNIQADQLTTAQLAVANQIKNNKFQQINTNQALIEAGKDPIEVPQEDVKASIVSSVKDVATIKTQTAATTYVAETVGGGIKAAYTTSVGWAAETAFGKWVADQFLFVESAAKSLFSKETAQQIYDKAVAERNKIQAGNTAK